MGTIMGEIVDPREPVRTQLMPGDSIPGEEIQTEYYPQVLNQAIILDNACKIFSQNGKRPGEIVFNFVKAQGKNSFNRRNDYRRSN